MRTAPEYIRLFTGVSTLDQEIRARLLVSLQANRLVMLAGAGLSMGEPTKLPAAAHLAASCARLYEEATDLTLDPAEHTDLERLARRLFNSGHLRSFLIKEVDWSPFRDNPNPAHEATADLLLSCGLEAVVSTNYDNHIESAAQGLGEGDFQAALDGDQVQAALARRYSPLLKLHGCCVMDRDNTIWLPEQLGEAEIARRVAASEIWARSALRNRDLMFVGFWTDWGYLNSVLESLLTGAAGEEERLVVLVDPASEEELREKAPVLWEWVTKTPGVTFLHVQEYSETFLDELRLEVSRRFLRQAWGGSEAAYRALTGAAPGPMPDCSTFDQTDLLYQLRRDMTGVGTRGAVSTLKVDGLEVVAAVQRRLLDLGATLSGCVFRLNDRTFRVVYSPARLMSAVKELYEAGPGGPITVDEIVCVGAIPDSSPSSIARPEKRGNVVRPKAAKRWITVEGVTDLLQGAA